MTPTLFQYARICATVAAVVCGLGGCGSSVKTPIVDASGSAAEAGADSGALDAPTADVPACPASCDDKNDCTIDSCDPNTFQCVHTAVEDGKSCEDGNTCTINDICQGGLCYSGPYRTCTASDQCHEAGVCSPKTGECTNPKSGNGKACDDGLKCTSGDQCADGVCQGTQVCPSFATCDPATGLCRVDGGGDYPIFPTALVEHVFEHASGPTNSNGLVRTPDGQIFVAGNFFNTTDLGTGAISTEQPNDPGNSAIFMAKLDPSTGGASWTQAFLGSQTQGVAAFAANGSGQLGLMGAFSGDIMIGDTELQALSATDQFILAASSTDGSGLWAKRVRFSGSKTQATGLRGMAGDPSPQPQGGAFVLCGTVNQDGTDLSPLLRGKAQWQGGTDIVVAGLDGAAGDTLWATQVGGVNDEDCAGVAMDGRSNTYVVGGYRFGSVVKFGNLPALPMVGDPKAVRMFVAKLGPQPSADSADADAQGSSNGLNAVWAVDFGERSQTQTIVSTAMLALGPDVVVAGTITAGALSLNGVDMSASGTFLAKLDGSTGSPAWVKGIGKAANVKVTALAERANGGLLLTGTYYTAFTLGTSILPAPPPSGFGGTFVAELDSNGNVLAAKGYGDPTYANGAMGVIGRTDGPAAEQDGCLLMLQFQGRLDLGQPIGLISPSNTQVPAICIATLAP